MLSLFFTTGISTASIGSPLPADMRRNLFDFDQVLNTQRNKVYATRRQALLALDLSETIIEFAEKTADDILEVRLPEHLLRKPGCSRKSLECITSEI